jgi:hypothetical protein
MLLHRYFGSHAFETLKRAELKTSRISAFNDPFEFLYVYASNMTCEQAEKYISSRCDDPKFLSWANEFLQFIVMLRRNQVLPSFHGKHDMDVYLGVGVGHVRNMSLLTELGNLYCSSSTNMSRLRR